MMIAVLTSTSNSPLNVRGMPCTNTSDLSQTLVCFSRQLLRSPSACHTGKAVALGDGNAVNHLVLLEDGVNLHWLLEKIVAKFDLVCWTATVDLDLHEVSLLLFERSLVDLSVCEDADDGAVFLDTLDFSG